MFYRQAWAEINLDHLDHNIAYLKSLVGSKKLIAVIKANGYGMGDIQIALSALKNGASYLAVSSLDEALCLRKKGITAPILVLGYIFPEHLLTALKYDVTITLTSLDYARKIKQSGISGLTMHIKIDTGMNRLGFKDAREIDEALKLMAPDHEIEGIFTHYVDSGSKNLERTKDQFNLFQRIVTQIDHSFKYIHLDNSDAIIGFSETFSNAVRAGIAMFGISSFPSTPLQPVCSLYARMIHVKKVPKGETISYGGTYATQENEWIATLPIGYADGWLRSNQGRTAYVSGYYGEFVGRICMDQCMLRVDKEYPVGTIVELFGKHLSIQDVAQDLNTIPYEILTLISDRVARVYRREFEVVAIENSRLDNQPL